MNTVDPLIEITIEDTLLGPLATDKINSVSVELALDKADLITLVVANPFQTYTGSPQTSDLLWTNSMAWAPGNLIHVRMGYGDKASRVGSGIIRSWLPSFPKEGVPTILLKAFDASVLMIDGYGGINASGARRSGDGVTLTDMVTSVFQDYGFGLTNIDDVLTTASVETIKKAGMTDFAFVRGLANMVGFETFVKWDGSQWQAFWRDPTKAAKGKKKKFTWGPDYALGGSASEEGILIEFHPEFNVQNVSTDVEVYYFDRDTKTWEQIVYPKKPESDDRGRGRRQKKAEFAWSGDTSTMETDLAAIGTADSARGLRIKAGDVSVEVIPQTGFRTAEEATDFAKAWWRARQNLLIQGRGTIVGDSEVAPGQTHHLSGLGPGLNGDWYFSEVVHRFSKGGGTGYITEFSARRVIE